MVETAGDEAPPISITHSGPGDPEVHYGLLEDGRSYIVLHLIDPIIGRVDLTLLACGAANVGSLLCAAAGAAHHLQQSEPLP